MYTRSEIVGVYNFRTRDYRLKNGHMMSDFELWEAQLSMDQAESISSMALMTEVV